MRSVSGSLSREERGNLKKILHGQEEPGFVCLKIPMPPGYDANRSQLATRPADEIGRIRLSGYLTQADTKEEPVVPASSRRKLERKTYQLPIAVGRARCVTDLCDTAIQQSPHLGHVEQTIPHGLQKSIRVGERQSLRA